MDGAEDYDLWLRLGKTGLIANIEQVLTKYRIHKNQVTTKKWFRANLQTAKVRISWILTRSNSKKYPYAQSSTMQISKTRMFKFLTLEMFIFIKTLLTKIANR